MRVQVRGVSDADARPTTFSLLRSMKEEEEKEEEEERQWDGSRVAVKCMCQGSIDRD